MVFDSRTLVAQDILGNNAFANLGGQPLPRILLRPLVLSGRALFRIFRTQITMSKTTSSTNRLLPRS
jgi:hypothetical protein